MLPLLRAWLQHLRIQAVTACFSVLQCVAVCCSVLQCVAVWCSVLQHLCIHAPLSFGDRAPRRIWENVFSNPSRSSFSKREGCMYAQVLQHTASQVATCSILQHTAINGNTAPRCSQVHTATHYTTLQHTATHCDTLHHTGPYCTTLQLTATHCNDV